MSPLRTVRKKSSTLHNQNSDLRCLGGSRALASFLSGGDLLQAQLLRLLVLRLVLHQQLEQLGGLLHHYIRQKPRQIFSKGSVCPRDPASVVTGRKYKTASGVRQKVQNDMYQHPTRDSNGLTWFLSRHLLNWLMLGGTLRRCTRICKNSKQGFHQGRLIRWAFKPNEHRKTFKSNISPRDKRPCAEQRVRTA